jgi:serine/threonine protein kinase
MDFGMARLSSAQGYDPAAGGTIGYMPPEQMMRETLDVRCDEWALASLTYEMISGGNPFLARDLSAAIDAIENAEIVLPSLCMQGLSAGADDVLFFALDPDRFERYDTVEDFSEEMDRFLEVASALTAQ